MGDTAGADGPQDKNRRVRPQTAVVASDRVADGLEAAPAVPRKALFVFGPHVGGDAAEGDRRGGVGEYVVEGSVGEAKRAIRRENAEAADVEVLCGGGGSGRRRRLEDADNGANDFGLLGETVAVTGPGDDAGASVRERGVESGGVKAVGEGDGEKEGV